MNRGCLAGWETSRLSFYEKSFCEGVDNGGGDEYNNT